MRIPTKAATDSDVKPATCSDGKRPGRVLYKRDGRLCYRCETPIERFDQGGRAVFICPLCQPPESS